VSLLITLGLGSDAGGGISPYMGLDIPVVSLTPGPLYAEDINQSLFTIDAHDHTPGNGKLVPVPSGLVVTGDWNFGGFYVYGLEPTRYLFQSAVLADTIVGAVYFKGVDLYVNDGNGVAIQITEAGAVNVAAGKGFSGDFGQPGVPAAVPYTAASHVFDFYEDPSGPTWAILGVGAIRFHSGAGTGAQYIALEAPALSGTSTFSLPVAPPASGKFGLWQQDSTGALTVPSLTTPVSNYSLLAFSTADLQTLTTLDGATLVWSGTTLEVGVIQTANIAGNAVTQPKLGDAPLVSATGAGASGNLTTQASFTALPNSPSAAFTLTAQRPVLLHQNLVGFANAGGAPTGADTIQLFYDIFNGVTHFYLPVLWPTVGVYFNQNDSVPSGTPTFTGAGDAADYQTEVLTAGVWTVSLVYKADTTTDGTHWSTTAVTIKAVVT
jgi:hypothetical protein